MIAIWDWQLSLCNQHFSIPTLTQKVPSIVICLKTWDAFIIPGRTHLKALKQRSENILSYDVIFVGFGLVIWQKIAHKRRILTVNLSIFLNVSSFV